MFDIDLFKQFNDTHGHQAGDKLLKSVAHAAQRQLRSADVLARYGGDEFVILLSNSNTGEAQQAGERIRASIAAQRLEIDNVPMQITISLGIAECSAEIETVDQLVQRADRALYRAKEAGRNCVVVFQK
jgi:diguanylate cyclase (GGDEF)-like protein